MGNGRFIRNRFDRTLIRQCNRLALLSNPSRKELGSFSEDNIPPLCELEKYLSNN